MRLLVGLCVVLPLLAAAPLHAQHLGARLQWQPEIADTDARLQQTVEIEIPGLPAIPALDLLSDATGVSLAVAPEDLTTVGERKLTLISKGLTLKAIMVQLPEALQECHWDIEPTGDTLVYYLHRNGSSEAMAEKQRLRLAAREQAERTATLLRRIDAARQALCMSPQQLAELEKTDPLFAWAMQFSPTREMTEVFLSLPDEDIAQFAATGELEVAYDNAPPAFRRMPQILVEFSRSMALWMASFPAEEPQRSRAAEELRAELDSIKEQLSDLSGAKLRFSSHTCGVAMQVGDIYHYIILPECEDSDTAFGRFAHFFLTQQGHDYASARAIAGKLKLERQQEAERNRAHEWDRRLGPEPTDPRLLRDISLPGHEEQIPLLHLQQAIATQTGLSVLSDAFSSGGSDLVPREELKAEMPLWHLLTYLSYRSVDWSLAGDCLVFHHPLWYDLGLLEAAAEPEADAAPLSPAP